MGIQDIKKYVKPIILWIKIHAQIIISTIKQFLRIISPARTILKKHKKNIITYSTIIGFIFIFIFLLFMYFRTTEITAVAGGEYREGLIGQPQFINPILATTDTDRALTRLIFSGLTRLDTNLTIQPDLAESISVNNDYKDYTLCLRDDAVFHDGEPVTSKDVLFTYETLKNPIFKNPLLKRLHTVVVSPVDERCVVFMLENPSFEFLHLLTLGVLPKHIWENVPVEAFFLPELRLKPIGSGPFKFSSLGKNNDNEDIALYTMVKNEQFYHHVPYLSKITFMFYNDFESAFEALKKHDIDGLSYSEKKDRETIKHLATYQLPMPSYTALFFNLYDSLINEQTIRTALAHLIDKEQIIATVLYGEGNIIHGPAAPLSPAFEPDVIKYEYNAAIAENILSQAGWKKNTNGLWEKMGKILEVKLTTPDSKNLLAAAKIISNAWQSIGIRVRHITVPSDQITEIITTRNFQIFMYGILQNFGNDFYPLWHSSQVKHPGINITGFSNRRVDELIEKASLTNDPQIQKKYYSEIQQVITQYIPAIFLYSPLYNYAIDDKIKGIDIQSIIRPEDRLINIENWYIKTKRVKKSTIGEE